MLTRPPQDRRGRARVSIAVGLAVSGTLLLGTGLEASSAPHPATVGVPAAPVTPASLIMPSAPVTPLALITPSAPVTPSPGVTLSPPVSTPPPSSGAAGPADVAPPPPAATPGEADVRDAVAGLVLPESDPVTVSIPTIDVRSPLVELGLAEDGTMEVPRNPDIAGWFTRGASPGALGPAVIGGHVTWDGAPGVFYRLDTLRRGDQVTVSRSDGRTAVFRITRVDRYAKNRFPTRAVYGTIDHAGLRLITCGGTYDRSTRRYLDNVVVFARLVAVRQPRG